jgi:hypothetical protein
MARYRKKAAYFGYDDAGDLNMTADVVIIEDDEPTYIGLVDGAGQKLYRESEKIPVGFDLRIDNG